MRTTTAAERAFLSSKSRSEHLRIQIKDSLGNWVDYRSLEGYNWIDSASFGDDNNNPSSIARIMLKRENEYLSAAPYMEDSKLNQYTGSYAALIDIRREIKIETATMPDNVEPAASDWKNRFEGRIDKINWASDPMEIECRDKSGELMDHFIKQQREYGSVSGVAVETVMQQILNDNGFSSITLYTPVSPGFNITSTHDEPTIVGKQPLLNALRLFADFIGWLVRYKWDSGTSQWRLTFYSPNRSVSTPDYSFDKDDYYSIQRNEINLSNIRNEIEITYTDITDGLRKTEVRADTVSIARYGLRHMELHEDASRGIDLQSEAITLGDRILADLKDPDLYHSVNMPPFWAIEIGDYYEFKANGKHYDTDQNFAVRSWQASYNKDGPTLLINTEGKPSSGPIHWLKKEARPGIIHPADFLGATRPGMLTPYIQDQRGLGPWHVSENGARNTLLPNSDFGISSRAPIGSGWAPDWWRVPVGYGLWGSAADVYVDYVNTLSGGRSLWFRNTSTTPVRAQSDPILIEQLDVYAGSVFLKATSTNAGDAHRVWVQFYQTDKATTVGSPFYIYNGRIDNSVGWYQVPLYHIQAPSNARWARIFVEKVTAAAHHLYVDSIKFNISPHACHVLGSMTIGTSPPYIADLTSIVYDYSGGVDLTNDWYQIQNPGVYLIYFTCPILNLSGASRYAEARILYTPIGGGPGVLTSARVYGVAVGGTTNTLKVLYIINSNVGDLVQIQFLHNDVTGVPTGTYRLFVSEVERV